MACEIKKMPGKYRSTVVFCSVVIRWCNSIGFCRSKVLSMLYISGVILFISELSVRFPSS